MEKETAILIMNMATQLTRSTSPATPDEAKAQFKDYCQFLRQEFITVKKWPSTDANEGDSNQGTIVECL